MKRPFAATLLAVIAVFAGIVAVFDTIRYLGILPAATFGSLNFYGGNLFGALLAGVVALIWFGVAAQIWRLDPRGWVFMVAIATIYIIFDLAAVLFGNGCVSFRLKVTPPKVIVYKVDSNLVD